MKIRVLGCDGGVLPGFDQVSFFINDHLIIDAGAICSKLSLKEQHQIKEILITHGHLDHIKDLPFLAENLSLSGAGGSVSIFSTYAILTDIKKNLLNGIVWPDFSRIPAEKPIYRLRSIRQPFSIGKLKIEAIPVTHSHSALGFIISDRKGAVIFSGDTAPTDELWQHANRLKNLKAIFLETSFPSALADLAWQTKHLSVTTLIRELSKIKNNTAPIYLYHLKPVYFKMIRSEIKRSGISRLRVLRGGRVFKW